MGTRETANLDDDRLHEDEFDDTLDEGDEDDDADGADSGAAQDDVGAVDADEEASAGTDDDSGSVDEQGEDPDKVDKDREAIRQRRREERHAKKVAARERDERYRAELAARDEVIARMQHQLDSVTKQSHGVELERAGRIKNEAVQAYNYWKEQIRVGTENQDGATVANATEKLLQAQARYQQAVQYETTVTNAAQQEQIQAQAQVDPRLATYASAWVKNNSWYDPKGTDPDSRHTRAIDTDLVREGYNPNSPVYWEELTRRVKNQLPHRFNRGTVGAGGQQNNSDDKGARVRSKPRAVVAGSGKSDTSLREGASHKGLSSDRVQALKDAGLWDDPAKRTAAIKEFQAYDKEHASAR